LSILPSAPGYSKPKTRAEGTGITPRHRAANRDALHTGSGTQPLAQISIESANLFGSLSEGNYRHIDG
jgi:hypothetical protein